MNKSFDLIFIQKDESKIDSDQKHLNKHAPSFLFNS
jgi:hypothetical protein